MNRFGLALAVVALAFFPRSSPAQVKLAVFDPQSEPIAGRGVVFEPAAARSDFRHGSLLRITLNDNASTRVQGALVRVDRKNSQLWVRAEPNSLPRAVAQKDIKSVEKAVRKSVNPIKPAVVEDSAIVQPEIHQMVVFNGGARTVHYFGPTLALSEQARLQELEDAENDFAELGRLQDQKTAFVDNGLALQSERQRSLALINTLLEQQANAGYWLLPPSSSFHVLLVKHDEVELGKYLTPPSADAMSKARAAVRAHQHRAVYENGRIVAVILDDQAGASK